jgi:dihydropteroate synthase
VTAARRPGAEGAADPGRSDAAPQLRLPRGRAVDLGGRPVLMGVVNVTPDSFYAGSRRATAIGAAEAAIAMEAAGAAIVDLGGESTRPGAAPVAEAEELERVLPAIEAVRARGDVALSVDTRRASVARAALDAGADIVNDVSALGDAGMAALAAERGVPLVLMHMRGEPATMQLAPAYRDCVGEVVAYLLAAAARAEAAGVARDSIVLDPGIGFGKRLEDNLALLDPERGAVALLARAGWPVLVGLSRKSLVGAVAARGGGAPPAEERLAGSLGAACAAFLAGARIFRVHDVAETADALAAFSRIAGARVPGGRRA